MTLRNALVQQPERERERERVCERAEIYFQIQHMINMLKVDNSRIGSVQNTQLYPKILILYVNSICILLTIMLSNIFIYTHMYSVDKYGHGA